MAERTTLWERFLRRLGFRKQIRVYQYEVHFSGVVIHPKSFGNVAKFKKSKTPLQWEISFEENPYFRTVTADENEALRRFEDDIISLIRQQEVKISNLPITDSPFGRWFEEAKKEEANTKQLRDFLLSSGEKDREYFENTGKLKVPPKVHFEVDDMSFDAVSSFLVPTNRLKTGEAVDSFKFLIKPPAEEIERNRPIKTYTGEFIHSL
jgi:hypothetical protein